MGFPFGLVTTRPEGPETGANQPVSENGMFSLDARSEFWEARSCLHTEIPGFVPDSTARHWRALLFLGFVFSAKVDRRRAESLGAREKPDARFSEIQRNRCKP
jgi:hypothetical protein